MMCSWLWCWPLPVLALLLLFAFPRPLIGLLSLVPALAGTGAAIFVYSLFHSSISIMVLGFGGAIISITVDHGIAYLLFLDRNRTTRGKDASHEVRAIGIMAVITSIGAFLILSYSGFPIFAELGQFTALGILFSFLFVHSIFPRIFPVMTPGNSRVLLLRRPCQYSVQQRQTWSNCRPPAVFGSSFFRQATLSRKFKHHEHGKRCNPCRRCNCSPGSGETLENGSF